MKTEVAIIGGGIVGCSAAYFLAKKGFQVLVIEKDPGVGRQASGRNGGGVRQQGRKGSLELSMEAIKLWATLEKELDADLEYERVGNLKITFDERNIESYEYDYNFERERGLKEVRLLSSAEAHALVPGLSKKIVLGKLCTTDGIANPMLASPAFARAGKKLGVNFLLNTKVTGYLKQGDTVCGVNTSKGEVHAKFVINAAGPWAPQIEKKLNDPMIIGPGNSQLMVTERTLRPFITSWLTISEVGYIRPTRSKNLVIGSSGRSNADYSYKIDLPSASTEALLLEKHIPWMKDAKIIRAFSGITEYTPDNEPYIGQLPEAPGAFVAAGFHGEGFCTGPMAGKILAELIDGKEAPISLEPFRPDRFADRINSDNKPVIKYPFVKQEKVWTDLLANINS